MNARNTRLSVACALALALCLSACAKREPEFDPARITERVRVLSGDDFEGRAPGSPAEEKTVAWLIGELQAAGVKPGGALQADGTRAWTQDVPLLRTEIRGPMAIGATAGRDRLQWTQGEDVAIRAALTGADRVEIIDAPVVFVGYGVTAPERDWDDFKDLDLAGKVALVLVNDPDFETGEGDFGGKAMTYYGRWTYKYEELARRGAAGALVIHETAPAAYGWPTVGNSNTTAMFDVVRADPLAQHVPLEGWIQRDVAADLLRRANLNFDALKAQAQTREFRPVVLEGVKFNARYDVAVEQVVSKNVVGLVEGKRHPDELVLYTSHWDHLGVGTPDASGDAIYNGAVDNAAGVSAVIEVARAFAQGTRPDRSVGFLLVTAEEKGLLGSEYYAANPLYPLARTVALVNLDAPKPSSPSRNFTAYGDGLHTLQDVAVDVAAGLGRSFAPDSRPEAGLFFRSDHFPFAKRGVPAISIGSGEDLSEGGLEAGRAASEAYTRDRYHQPADEFDPAEWRSDGIAADAALVHAIGRRLANSRDWPEWKEGVEFKQARDATADQRR